MRIVPILLVFIAVLHICGCASLDKKLIKAVDKGNSSQIEALIKQGASVNAQNKKGVPVLLRAVVKGDPNAVKLLLDNGADIEGNKDQLPPVFWAAVMGKTEIVKLFVNKGIEINARDDSGTTLLMAAALPMDAKNDDNKIKLVDYLLQKGADLNAVNNERETALFRTLAAKDRPGLCNFLISKGTRIDTKNIYGVTPLIVAADAGNLKVVKTLIQNGADVQAVDNKGMSALMRATWTGNVDVVRTLLDHGVDVNAVTSGGASLAYLKPRGHTVLDDFLYAMQKAELGQDVDAVAAKGMTALMIAAMRGHLEVVKLLISKGADVNAKDDAGNTAITYALSRGHIEVGNVLVQARTRGGMS